MANVIIFTGTSRTDPAKVYDKQDQAAAVLTRPLGAYQIANILRLQGYTVQVVDRYHWLIRNRPQDLWFNIISKFVGEDTLWIGWSNTFWEAAPRRKSTLDNSYEQPAAGAIGFTNKGLKGLQELRKRINPNIKFVMGGGKTWRMSQQDFRFFDYYFEGYSDHMVVEFTNWLAGKGDKPPTRPADDMSEIVDYDKRGDKFDFNNHVHCWHETDYLEHGEPLPIEISRGCIFRCAYCSFPLNGKKKLDYIRDAGLLREEFVRNYELYGTTKYMYGDDTHNDSPEKLEFLYNEVYSKLPFKIEFATYLRLDLLAAHPHTIELLKESGLVGTFFGIESFNHAANKTVGKGATEEKIYENLYKCKEVWKDQVFIHSGLLVGLPNDNEETIRKWCMRAMHKDSPLDWAMITELHLFPNYGKDAHWLNKMELNPEFYGYKFDEDGVNWTNNVGFTKLEAVKLAEELIEYRNSQKQTTAQAQGWYSFARAASMNMPLDQYLNTHTKEIVEKRDVILNRYCDRLIEGAKNDTHGK